VVFAPMHSLYRCEASLFTACTYDKMNIMLKGL
jgi:hypothetical protein